MTFEIFILLIQVCSAMVMLTEYTTSSMGNGYWFSCQNGLPDEDCETNAGNRYTQFCGYEGLVEQQ